MRAGRGVWFAGPRRAELREEAVREPGPGEVLLAGLSSLISAGTEMNVYRGEVGSAEELALPTARGTFPFPMSYGYQVVARVVATGAGVELAPGDRVFAVHPHQDLFVMPASVPVGDRGRRRLATPLPDELGTEQAAFANLFAVGLNAMLDVPVRYGDVVVVTGLGVVGTFAAMLARRTAGALVVVDPLAPRRDRASWIGADASVHPDDADDAVAELSGGRGADIVIEASGAASALQTAITVTGEEGTVVVLSYYGTRQVALTLSPEFHYRRQHIVSSMVGAVGSGLQPRWDRDRRTAVAYDVLRHVDVDRLVTHRLPFERAVEAYRWVDESPADVLGVLLEYGPDRPTSGF